MKILLALLIHQFLTMNICAANNYVEDDRSTEINAAKVIDIPDLKKWRALKPENYYFILNTEGFLVYHPLVAIYVINGKISEVVDIHPFTSKNISSPDRKKFPTIDGLFEEYQKALNSDSIVEIKYDDTFGYPEHFSYKIYSKVHSEKKYKILDFRYIKLNK